MSKKIKIKFDPEELEDALKDLLHIINYCDKTPLYSVIRAKNTRKLFQTLKSCLVDYQLAHPKPKPEPEPEPEPIKWEDIRMQAEVLEFHMDDILEDSPYKEDLKALKDNLKVLIKTRGNL